MDVIDGFMDATSNMASPASLRRWSAISLVSCIASRRVWTCIEDDLPLYPNTFIWLVSPPGIGKSRPMDLVSALLSDFGGVACTGDEVTREEMIQHVAAVFNEDVAEGDWSFVINISEIATFMPKPDVAWMQALARLWDCPRMYTRRTKHMGKDFAYNVYCSMLVGAQPAWFASGFPQHSYDLGLPARIHFIYADEKPQREFFRDKKQVTGMEDFKAALEKVHAANGQLMWTDAAKAAWVDWTAKGLMPVPNDALLRGYTVRRDMHAAKLAMVSALSAHPGHLVIDVPDLERAWSWLFEAEQHAPRALAAAGGNAWNMAQEAIMEYARERIRQTALPVEERFLRRQLNKMVPATMVDHILEELIAQQRLKALPSSVTPLRRFKLGAEAV